MLLHRNSFQDAPGLSPDSYPDLINGGEKPDERPPAGFATRASLSKWFASREDHHGSVPDSHPGVPLPSEIRAHRHGGRRLPTALGQDGKHQRLNDLVSRTLWIFTLQRTDLQQAYSQRRQQAQQAHQAVNRLQLPVLNATATFQALLIVLRQPAVPIPVHPLPGLFERGGRDRGKPDPFQRLLAYGSLLLPDADDPHVHGVAA